MITAQPQTQKLPKTGAGRKRGQFSSGPGLPRPFRCASLVPIMSDGKQKKGSSGGLKGILLVVGLGVAFLVQKFTGIDLMGMLNKDKGAGDQQVSESDEGTDKKQPSLPGGGTIALPKEETGNKTVQPKAPEKKTEKPAPKGEGKGGVLHFTHRADRPTKRKPGGWIDYNGKRYQ